MNAGISIKLSEGVRAAHKSRAVAAAPAAADAARPMREFSVERATEKAKGREDERALPGKSLSALLSRLCFPSQLRRFSLRWRGALVVARGRKNSEGTTATDHIMVLNRTCILLLERFKRCQPKRCQPKPEWMPALTRHLGSITSNG